MKPTPVNEQISSLDLLIGVAPVGRMALTNFVTCTIIAGNIFTFIENSIPAMEHSSYMKLAIKEASDGIRRGEGGPFGAVVVRDGEILGSGHNTVLLTNDPTAHAEINAIRNASVRLKDHHLTGAVLYTNFEPCPMCLAAIYWADIRRLVYCADRTVAEKAGFMDNKLYNEISLPQEEREIDYTLIEHEDMHPLLNEWEGMEGKILY